MHKPEISVIMATFNDEKFIIESIESVLTQTFQDFEFIIINDCSTDNTLTIIQSYQERDKRIIVINNPKNMGLTKNLNYGMKIAQGKYIARMDADDIAMPTRLELQYEYLEANNNIFLLGTGAEIIDENGYYQNHFSPICNSQQIAKKLENENCFYHPTIMFKNEGFMYRDKFIYSQDYDFYLCLLSEGKTLVNIPNKLLKYRRNSNGISQSKGGKQLLFKEKAMTFYFHRKIYGIDNYTFFNPEEIISTNALTSNNKTIISGEIIASFKSNDFQSTKIFCYKYFGCYGWLNKFLVYYILSFTSKNFVNLLRRLFF